MINAICWTSHGSFFEHKFGCCAPHVVSLSEKVVHTIFLHNRHFFRLIHVWCMIEWGSHPAMKDTKPSSNIQLANGARFGLFVVIVVADSMWAFIRIEQVRGPKIGSVFGYLSHHACRVIQTSLCSGGEQKNARKIKMNQRMNSKGRNRFSADNFYDTLL